jgi:hypothetical protein
VGDAQVLHQLVDPAAELLEAAVQAGRVLEVLAQR